MMSCGRDLATVCVTRSWDVSIQFRKPIHRFTSASSSLPGSCRSLLPAKWAASNARVVSGFRVDLWLSFWFTSVH